MKKFSPTMADLTDLFDRVEYSYKTGAKEMTPERKIAANIPPTDNKIYNVVDAEKELRILCLRFIYYACECYAWDFHGCHFCNTYAYAIL